MDFETLAREHKDAVYRQLLRMCHNREDAEDILIEALAKAFRSREELRDPESFRAWLAQIARRAYHRMRKQQAHHPTTGIDMLPPGIPELRSAVLQPDEAAMEEELDLHLKRALDALPEMYREVYLLHDIEGMPAREVCARLGLSLPAVKSRLRRAREMVRLHLDRIIHPAS
ncbi:MAG: sigma-70 family RNA polymerase sigma factor [Bryobacterales bacterium]|nr:sigma-70 family RNA polymerase sigma factor [Bryobacterales bacterium]